MKKILMSSLAVSFAVLMAVSMVSAQVSSYRGSGGELSYIGDSNYDNNLIASKVQLSFWTKGENNGKGSLNLIARDPDNKRVVLNLQMDQYQSYYYILDGKMYMHFGATGTATYWKQGEGTSRISYSMINYDYELSSGLTDIYGYGSEGINFEVLDIPTKLA